MHFRAHNAVDIVFDASDCRTINFSDVPSEMRTCLSEEPAMQANFSQPSVAFNAK